MKFKDFMELFKFWKQVEEDPDIELPSSFAPGTQKKEEEEQMEKQFTEEDLKKAGEEAARKAKEEAQAEFAEKEKEHEKNRQAETRKADISQYCDGQVEKGKLAPAWIKAGLREFMEGLDAQEEITFSENKKQAPLAWFEEFLESLPKLVEFDEIAGRDKDPGGGNAGEKLEALVSKKLQDNKDLSYGAAFSEVQKEHPDLATEYQNELQEVK